MQIRILALATSLGLAALAAAQAPNLAPQTFKPFRTITTGKAVRIDTRSFQPQIAPNTLPGHEMPENPTSPLWNQPPLNPNTIPLGGMLDESRGKGGAYWAGISATGWFPADPVIAVGPNHVVECVNCTLGWYLKNGTQQYQQPVQNFFVGLGATSFQFDPRVVYDRLVNRWVVVYDEQDSASQTSKILIGVSQTSDPNGGWYLYRIESKLVVSGLAYWLDYPSLGYNNDGYVITGNMFGFSSGYQGVQFIVLPKAPMLTGAAVTATYFRDPSASTSLNTVQLGDTINPADPGVYGVRSAATTAVRLYAINGIASVPTLNATTLSVPTFSQPTGGAPSHPGFLDTLDGRIFSTTYRGGHVFATHNVSVGGTTQVRWYDIDMAGYPSGTPVLIQSGNLSTTGGAQLHMGAAAQNGYQDISAIMTRSSTSIPADAVFTGRVSTDTLGFMGAPVLLENSAGANYQSSGTNRWGDYFRCVVDPVDDATFWGVAMTATATGDWRANVYSWTVTPPAVVSANSLPTGIITTTTGTGTIILDHAAPQNGYVVGLQSSNPALASVPASVTVPGGATSANFTISAGVTSVDTAVTITASLRGVNTPANTTILSPRVVGHITLGGLSVSPSGQQVTVQVRTAGTTTVLDSYTTTLDASGQFMVQTNRVGVYDIAVQGTHWLRKVTANVTFGTAGANFNATLLNGDVNHDNAVTLADFSALRAAYGSTSGDPNWNPAADLNGDGAVTLGDFSILRANYGQNGDN